MGPKGGKDVIRDHEGGDPTGYIHGETVDE